MFVKYLINNWCSSANHHDKAAVNRHRVDNSSQRRKISQENDVVQNTENDEKDGDIGDKSSIKLQLSGNVESCKEKWKGFKLVSMGRVCSGRNTRSRKAI